MHQMDMPMDYHALGAMLEHCHKYTPKPINIAELKPDSLTMWNDLLQEFIDKAIRSFRRRLRSCFAAAAGYTEHFCLNTEWAPDIHH